MELITTAHNGRPGIAPERLGETECQRNFCEMHTPLEGNAARVEAERCYFCFDAPCTEACPTGIDIPGFIRMIANGNPVGAAGLILEENVMGGTCARDWERKSAENKRKGEGWAGKRSRIGTEP